MYTIYSMKGTALVLSFFTLVLAVASMPTSLSLPSGEYADTEVTTNVVISSWQRGVAKFAFSLSCIVTPSNNVEAAFGEDVNTNGVLEPDETDLIVGWKRGNWFIRHGTDGERLSLVSTSVEDVKTLAWSYRLSVAPTPARLEVTADGVTAFSALAEDSPEWLHRREWNLMRLTGRGLYDSDETFTVGTPLDPTAILFR